ncbi:MAG TPA: sigma-54 dependent transcriptional regulator [Steroidobacteraceae bacterium]|nr:sigma-54 dependent transcriptional regulator [Steroidobacteraceae bacterium]
MNAQIHTLRPDEPVTRRCGAAAGAPLPPPLIDLVQHPTGPSNAARAVREQIAQVARFNTTVLVLGESGTGKEVVARQIHLLSNRTSGPFVPVNCGAIPAELLESELFGHERGAFTGAISSRQGRFEIAQGGTLFLDEIGEMSPHMQVKLLRVLQSRSFERVGSSQTLEADVRIIAATHRDLEGEVRAGRFREDLYFRLNVFPIQMPALRERTHDFPALVQSFHQHLELRGHVPVTFDDSALAALTCHAWPGNIRELENLLERLSVMQPGAQLGAHDLPERYRPLGLAAACIESVTGIPAAPPAIEQPEPEALAPAREARTRIPLPAGGVCLKTLLAELERDLVEQALLRADGVVSRAARLLKLGRTTLLEKMRKLQLIRPDAPPITE